MHLDGNRRIIRQFCTSDYEIEETTAFQITFSVSDSFIKQTLMLALILNKSLKRQKETLSHLVLDFIQDENDSKYYMLQIKFIESFNI